MFDLRVVSRACRVSICIWGPFLSMETSQLGAYSLEYDSKALRMLGASSLDYHSTQHRFQAIFAVNLLEFAVELANLL